MAEIPKSWLREETMSPRDVGKLFDVGAATVARWARSGMIGFFRTPHGLRRFPVSEVERLMAARPPEDPQLLIDLANEDYEKYRAKRAGGWRNNGGFGSKRESADDD